MGNAIDFLTSEIEAKAQAQEATRPTGQLRPFGERAQSRARMFLLEPGEKNADTFVRGLNMPGDVLFRNTGPGQEFLSRLEQQGVDVTSGAPSGIRAVLSMAPEEIRGEILKEAFPDGIRDTPVGKVVKMRDPETGDLREVLLDEKGMSLKDFADVMGPIVEAGGALGTALAVAPGLTAGTLSLIGLAALAAAGGQLAGGAAELIQLLKRRGLDLSKEKDAEILANIAKRRGLNATVDFLFDLATAGLARLGGKAINAIIAPNARNIKSPAQQELIKAAERQGIELTPGLKTGNESIIIGEQLLQKVPGSAGVAKREAQRADESFRKATQKLTGESPPEGEAAGARIKEELRAQNEALAAKSEQERILAEAKIDQRLKELADELDRRSLSTSESGSFVRDSVLEARTQFRNRQRLLAENTNSLIAELPFEQRAFVPTDIVKAEVGRLERQFPKETIVEEVPTGLVDEFGKPLTRESVTRKKIPELFPAAARSILKGLKKLDSKTTVEELRNARNVVNQMISDAEAFPGVGVGMLKRLEGALTEAIKSGIDKAPSRQVARAIAEELTHFRNGVQQFQPRIIRKIMRKEDMAGAVEDEDVLPRLLLRNKFEDARRVLRVIGASSPAAMAARRATFDELIHKSRNNLLGGSEIDPKVFARELNKLRPETKQILFGDKAKEVEDLARLLAARGGVIDVSVIKDAPGNADILDLLRTAAQRDIERKQIFDRQVFKRLIAGDLDPASVAPEDVIKMSLTDASLSDMRLLMKRLPENLRDEYRQRLIIHLLDKASARAGELDQEIGKLFTKTTPVGDKLVDVMTKDFGPDTATSLKKLKTVLGEDAFNILRDLAIVSAARARAATVGRTAGGLVRGSILSSLAEFRGNKIGRIVKYRIVAGLLRNKATRKWLSSGIQLPTRKARTAAFQVALPQIIRVFADVFGENSEEVDKARQFMARPEFKKILGVL